MLIFKIMVILDSRLLANILFMYLFNWMFLGNKKII